MKLTSTTPQQLKQFGSPGQRSVELIRATLSDRLTERHADLFAEPLRTPLGDRIDWLSQLEGRAQRLTDLPDNDAEIVRNQLTELVRDILGLADTLENDVSKDSQRLGEALRYAVEIPDETNSIFVVETPSAEQAYQPVLVNWAHSSDATRINEGILSGRVSMRQPLSSEPKTASDMLGGAAPYIIAPANSSHVDRGPRPWWWLLMPLWLLVVVLTAWLFWLMIPTCGLNFGDRFNFCPQEVVSDDTGEREQLALVNRIDQLEREFALLDQGCAPPPPQPQEEARAPDNIDERLDRENAQDGELTVTLAWDSTADLDLHVTCPGGDTIFYENRGSMTDGCGGMLDIDANAGIGGTSEPVEHIVFENPSPGEYRVRVHLFRNTAPPQTQSFRLRIQTGSDIQNLSGSVGPRNPEWIHTLTYGN
ncbi:MAG: hypothetical protein QNL92_02495 [Octadecabacter sp.]